MGIALGCVGCRVSLHIGWQVNERLFLYFEVPRWNGNSRSNLCNAQKLADEVRAYFADEELC